MPELRAPARKVRAADKAADNLFRLAAGVCAGSPVLFLAAISAVVLVDALPVIRFTGWHFLTDVTWNLGNLYGNLVTRGGISAPAGASYGALAFIVGTLASSAIGLLMAVPVSILTAVILAYQVRGPLRSLLSTVVEGIAGIPSVVIGLWGVVVLAPWVARELGPVLTGLGIAIPFFRGPVGTGMGLLTSGIVLGLMVVPVLTATTRDLLERVPVLLREGGIGLGMTHWEVVRWICLPYIRQGLMGVVALRCGRAVGETMAVLMVSGNAVNLLPQNLYSP
ncbi:MAG: phosphate ABC transporter permease subunit PstC, partial [Alicyclobacillus sp.]|nr:phosphate ABC transporter permease subunit PstC [Alicyclobacillus sp.]